MTVRDDVLDDVTPDDEERRRLEDAYRRVADRARAALDDVGVGGEVALVGSTARDTWLAGDRDIDVFLLLPPSLDRERFEEVGLDVGKAVFPDGDVDYAEHPYVAGEEDGFDVDVVPCYAVDAPADARSAVDRTPFHTAYVEERLDGDTADEVRLLKAFVRGAGVYGSELRVRGFSGYLCELLVLYYGDFEGVVDAAVDWRPDVVLDPGSVGGGVDAGSVGSGLEGPLIVVDPTDPDRNVAAAVSDDSFARFVHHCREWQRAERIALFEPATPSPLDAEGLREALGRRGTRLFAVLVETPDVVDDQLYPQLRKTRDSLVGELDRRGFDVLRSSVLAEDRCGVLLECNVAEQSAVERHEGPPVSVREHAESFLETYRDTDVTGPFVDDGRYVVERPREHATVRSFLASDDLLEVAIGADLAGPFEEGYEVSVDGDCAELLDDFGEAFARHFDPDLPG